MATSTNYGWAEPDNTSLVKDGAQAIRTLGDAIDTSLWNSGYGQAGKNKIINGDFSVNQRNFTTSSGGGFGFDRFNCATSGATATSSAQTFALGTAPVVGYESKNFLRWAVTTGNDYCRVVQNIESVRTFAGQTITFSFWAKGTNPTTAGNLRVRLNQYFGSGGSPSASVSTAEPTFVLTANWTRYSFTFALASIAGKTIGTNNDDCLQVDIGQLGSTSTDAWTLDTWGWQLEYGAKATPFQTASGGSIQGELAMCQRYYYRWTSSPSVFSIASMGNDASSTTAGQALLKFPVTMRTTPPTLDTSGTFYYAQYAGSAVTLTGLAWNNSTSQDSGAIAITAASGLSNTTKYQLLANNAGSPYIGFSAEL